MKPLLAIVIVSLFAHNVFAQDGKSTVKMDTLVQRLGEAMLRDPQSVGLSIGIYSNGKSSFYNFGTTTKRGLSAPSKNTIYEIASITKTFGSYLLAKAVLEMKINLSDDIHKYIEGDFPNLEFAGQPIQVVHLANTTSGLPDWIPALPDTIAKASSDSILLFRANIYGKYGRKDFFDGLHRVKLDTIPGLKVRHSNGAAHLLAYILEDIYHMPFETMVKRYILEPAGLNETFFVVPDSQKEQLANGYNEKGNPTPPDFSIPYFWGEGGLKSTTSDLIKYIRLQLDDRSEIIKINHKRTLDIDANTNKVVHLLPDSLVNAGVYSVGLNWLIYEPERGSTQIWTDGGSHGFCSYLVFYPEIKSGVVVLANKSDEHTFRELPDIAFKISQAIRKQ